MFNDGNISPSSVKTAQQSFSFQVVLQYFIIFFKYNV